MQKMHMVNCTPPIPIWYLWKAVFFIINLYLIFTFSLILKETTFQIFFYFVMMSFGSELSNRQYFMCGRTGQFPVTHTFPVRSQAP